MATLAELRDRIAGELANDGDITAVQIVNAINTALAHYGREAFWFNQKAGTFISVPGQEYYGLADLADIPNMVSVLSMRRAGGELNIRGVDNDAIEDSQDGSVTGDPDFYSRFGKQIRLYPIPVQAEAIKISYITKFPALSADTDTNAFTDECEELVRQAAKRIICTDILLADDMAGRYAALEQQAYAQVKAENRLRQPQKTLRTELPFGNLSFRVL